MVKDTRAADGSGDGMPLETITQRIVVLRGQKVILDADLAALYGVDARRLNEQVRRNQNRFPNDFLFVLTTDEFNILKSQIATSSWGGKRKLPLAFTEHGAIMAASVLNSPRAISVSVYVVRAFIRLREAAVSNQEMSRRLDDLEDKTELMAFNTAEFEHSTREQLKHIFDALRELISQPEPAKKRPIGFITPDEMASKTPPKGSSRRGSESSARRRTAKP